MLKTWENRLQLFSAVLLVLTAAYLCFTNLDKSLSSSDECLHISVVQGMIHSGNWWLPMYEGEPYFRKPPFKMWLSIIPVLIFGETNAAFRMLDASLGILYIGLVLVFGKVVLKNYWAGFLGALLLLCNRAFTASVHSFRHGTQDSMLHVLQFIAMWLFFVWYLRFREDKSKSQKGLAIGFGVAIGCSVLTKNVLGFLAPALCFVFLCLQLKIHLFVKAYWKEILLSLLFALSIPGTYMVPHFIFTEGAFTNMFASEVVDRVSVGMHNQDSFWYYFKEFWRWEFIPIPFLVAAFLYGLVFGLFRRDTRTRFLFVWAVVPISVFTFIPSRLNWYIADSYPAITMLAGLAIVYLVSLIRQFEKNRLLAILAVALLLLILKPIPRYGPRFWRTATRITRRIPMDTAVDRMLEHESSKILVYGPAVHWSTMFDSRVEKFYLRKFRDRLEIESDLERFIEKAATEEYDFILAPRKRFEETRALFAPRSFVKLMPFQDRSEKVFLLSRVPIKGAPFRKSKPA